MKILLKNKENKIVYAVLILFLIILAFYIIKFSEFKYPLPGDGFDHWNFGQAIQNDQSILSYNVLFSEAPLMYPQGYHVLFVVFSNLTNISTNKTFLLLPVILYLFYFCSLYFFTKFITKNRIIAAFSGLSIFLYWTYNPRYLFTISYFSYALPEFLNIFLFLIIYTALLKNNKKWFIVASILTFASSFVHRTTSIALFIFLGVMIFFEFFKKDKKRIISLFFLLFLLGMGWSIQFLPNMLEYGIPSGAVSGKLSPNISAGANKVSLIPRLLDSLKQEYEFFTRGRYFHFGKGFSFTYIWILLIIMGITCLFKNKMITYPLLPYFSLPLLHIINKLSFNIKVIGSCAYFFFTPIAYFIFSGVGLYYLLFSMKRKKSILLCALLIIILLLSLFVIINNVPRKPEGVGVFALQGNIHLGISDEAIEFLKETPSNSTILACPITSKTLAITTRRTVLHTYYGHYGLYVFQLYNISERHEDVRMIYESCDFNETERLMNKYGKNIYIYMGAYDQGKYNVCFDKFERYFKKEDFGKDKIFYLGDSK